MTKKGIAGVRNRRGFTLIELLVVVAIIAVLISILLPALGNARQIAKGMVCLNKAKQIGTAYLLYSNDYNDYLPGYYNCVTWNGVNLVADPYWPDKYTAKYLGGLSASNKKTDAIFRCDDDPFYNHPKRYVKYDFGTNEYFSSDYINNFIGTNGPLSKKATQVSAAANSSKTCMVAENWGHSIVDHGYLTPPTYNFYNDPTNIANIISLRHQNKCPVNYVDGHGDLTPMKKIPCSQSYPTATWEMKANTNFWRGEVIGTTTIPGL